MFFGVNDVHPVSTHVQLLLMHVVRQTARSQAQTSAIFGMTTVADCSLTGTENHKTMIVVMDMVGVYDQERGCDYGHARGRDRGCGRGCGCGCVYSRSRDRDHDRDPSCT